MSIITLDFETYEIKDMPDYPPAPVGLAVKENNRPPRYLDSMARMGDFLEKVKKSKDEVLFHNSAYDQAVMEKAFGFRIPPNRVHDTLFLLFLDDPRSRRYSLKPAARHHLGVKTKNQDNLKKWILEHISEATEKDWGKYIGYAPRKMTAPYAKDDVNYTKGLFDLLYKKIVDAEMDEAYRVEIDLVPLTYEMENSGIRIDYKNLLKDTLAWIEEVGKLEKYLMGKLGKINVNSGAQLYNALVDKGFAPREEWPTTEKGNPRTTRKVLQQMIKDKRLVKALTRFSVLRHMISNFCNPWLDKIESYHEARLYPRFNQVLGYHDTDRGTKSGRYSSSNPNFQQLNREPEDPTLPFMRKYILPEEGHILLGRDYSQQELRILAHFEDGALLGMYLDNPKLDLHNTARELIVEKSGIDYGRPKVKATMFTIIYGGGGKKLAKELELDEEREGYELKANTLKALPGVRKLIRHVMNETQKGYPIRTQGGRLYYAEPGKEYKMINQLIQGSAADHTKRAMLKVKDAMNGHGAQVKLTNHDELLVSGDRAKWKSIMSDFKEAMEFKYFDLDTPTEGKKGKNWGTMKPCL